MLFDKIDVGDDIIPSDGLGVLLIEIGKDVTNFTTVVTNSSGRVVFSMKVLTEFDNECLSFWIEIYSPELAAFLKSFMYIHLS